MEFVGTLQKRVHFGRLRYVGSNISAQPLPFSAAARLCAFRAAPARGKIRPGVAESRASTGEL